MAADRHLTNGAEERPSPENSDIALDLRLTTLSLGGVPILGKIDLSIPRSQTLALVGPSGIGKTSLLRIIAGIENGYHGQCNVAGRISMIFQEPTLLPWRSVQDNIMIAARVSEQDALAVLDDVGLKDRAMSFPDQLSLGQQRRLSLARAFAAKPDILLMDEPFVSLDPDLANDMMALFAGLSGSLQLTTILVTHIEDEAQKLADRIVTLGGHPATITEDRQNSGAYFQLSASGVTSSRS